MVSVIMSIYKEDESWIKSSIESILNQSYREIEFVIVCDNPQNLNAIRLLEEYASKDKRVVYIINDCNVGLTKSLNIAINYCHGEYIARMDADDISLETRIQEQVEFLDSNAHVGFVGCYYSIIDADGNITKRMRKLGKEMSSIFVTNPICHPTVMFRHSMLKIRAPFYNEDYKSSQDYELWSFLVKNSVRFSNIPEVLLKYRVTDKQVSAHKKDEQSQHLRALRREMIHWYLLKSNIIQKDDFGKIDVLIPKVSKAAYLSTSKERGCLWSILYSLYYTAVGDSVIWIYKILVDKNPLLKVWSVRMSTKLILAKLHQDIFLGY